MRKTNEEYRFFKAAKDNTEGFGKYRPNEKDPNEPFFNRNKFQYKNIKKLKEILEALNITEKEWDDFVSGSNDMNHNNSEWMTKPYGYCPIYNSRGVSEYDEKSEYYWVYLDIDGTYEEDAIYFFPDRGKLIVKVLGKREVFNYEIGGKPPLKEAFELVRKKIMQERIEDKRRGAEEHIKYVNRLAGEDDISSEENPPADDEKIGFATRTGRKKQDWKDVDTTTFDSYNFKHLNTFENFKK